MRRILLMECEDHTLQRLRTGLVYDKGVKGNFLFFDQWPGAEATWMRRLWMYVARTNKHFKLKPRRMSRTNLDEYLAYYRPGDRPRSHLSEPTPEARWRPFTYEEILACDEVSLGLFSGSGTKVWKFPPSLQNRTYWLRISPSTFTQHWRSSRSCPET